MVTKSLLELDKLILVAEAQIPANINAPANQKLEKALRQELAKYFGALANAFPYDRLDELYYRYISVVKESLGAEAGNILDSLIRAFGSGFFSTVSGHLTNIYLSGSVEMMTWGRTKAGIPIAYEGPPIERAIDYANKHCAQLVTQMDEETKSQLAKIIGDGIENKRGIPGLERDIRSAFADMTKTRSEMIARTETNDALSQAFIDKAHDMAIDGKEWLTYDPCDICAACGAEGVVPIDFEYDHDGPDSRRTPAHPNCRCSLAPVMLGGKAE